jgi:hypothetical protein
MKITLIIYPEHNTWYLTQLRVFQIFTFYFPLDMRICCGGKGYFNVAQDDFKFWSAEITGVITRHRTVLVFMRFLSFYLFLEARKRSHHPLNNAPQISSAK